MYVVLLKNREVEKRVAKELNTIFSPKIIPLFEIVDEIYETTYKTDENGEYIKEIKVGKDGKARRCKIKIPKRDGKIITLDAINDIVNGAKVFIDYFRFSSKRYGDVDADKVNLAIKLSHNQNEYINKLKIISIKYKNMIPVLSIKEPFDMIPNEVENIINQLQELNNSIAFRIEDNFFDKYRMIIERKLRSSDYFFYDIGEQSISSKEIDLKVVSNCNIKATKILLNSPKSIDNENKFYENNQITSLVNNDALSEYKKYNFDGFGDYGGLKDQLPTNNRNNGYGSCVALLYNFSDNAFYSFCNPDTSLGVRGYNTVIKDVLNFKPKLDPDNKCLAYKAIESLNNRGKAGNWGVWNNITLKRYLHQIYRFL